MAPFDATKVQSSGGHRSSTTRLAWCASSCDSFLPVLPTVCHLEIHGVYLKKTLKLGKSHRALCDKTWCELLVVTFKPSDLCHHLTGCPQTAEDWAHCHIGAAIGRTGLQRKLTPHLQPPGVPQRCSYRSSPRLHALETSYQSIDVTLLYLPKTYKKKKKKHGKSPSWMGRSTINGHFQ